METGERRSRTRRVLEIRYALSLASARVRRRMGSDLNPVDTHLGGLVLLSPGIVEGGLTVIVISEVLVKEVSDALSRSTDAVSRSTYVPGAEKTAVVLGARSFTNTTVPGPLTLLHVTDKRLPAGRPSSEARPSR